MMRLQKKCQSTLIWIPLILMAGCLWVSPDIPTAAFEGGRYQGLELAGRIQDTLLTECSGMDISMATGEILWAINDGGHGPYLHALDTKGGSLARILVEGAKNRDWEAIDTFVWEDRPMILIADFGDNFQVYGSHTLYVVEEPVLNNEGNAESLVAPVAWQIHYSYPGARHDAEGAAVNAETGKVLILTKRDSPPILYEVPLQPPKTAHPVVAKKIATLDHLKAPPGGIVFTKYDNQPTALDISNDGKLAVVLTYTNAHLFVRSGSDSWARVFGSQPALIRLPHPQERMDFRQREAIFFGPDQVTLFVTSEGQGAGIFRMAGDH